jgi:hypothetical protein
MEHNVPRATERFLVSYGGKNPFGKPKWRLVVASERLIKEAGVYRDWAEGLSTAEKGGLNFSPNPDAPGCNFQRYDNKPIRVVTEMREVRKYPQAEGWILENWWPASRYGTREEWHSYKAVDGITPMLGPYPECGDYEFIFALGLRLPTIATLESHISKYVNTQANKKGTPEQRAREYMQRYQEQLEQEEQKRTLEYEAQFRDHLTPLHSGSLAASRWRQELAARTGNRNEHIGIL